MKLSIIESLCGKFQKNSKYNDKSHDNKTEP